MEAESFAWGNAGLSEEQRELVVAWIAKQLVADRYAGLEHAGIGADNKVALARVFVDLPLERDQDEEQREGFLSRLRDGETKNLEDHVLEAEGARYQNLQRVLLLGGPGQGKSTLVSFLAQMHRAALLDEEGEQTGEVRTALDELRDLRSSNGRIVPLRKKLPFLVRWADFAEWALRQRDVEPSLLVLSFVAKAARVDVAVIERIARTLPTLWIFDGLDEVSGVSGARALARGVSHVVSLSTQQAQCIFTSRPLGIFEDFADGTRLELALLKPPAAKRYADGLITSLFGADETRAREVRERIDAGIKNELTAKLLTTPLQITIMTVLADVVGTLPEQRWRLFQEFYDAIYKRELRRAKEDLRSVLNNRSVIDEVHRRVGLRLQAESEGREAASAIPLKRLEETFERKLKEDGFDDSARPGLVRKLRAGATERLVVLKAREADRYQFEVRSLQEFMAAWALSKLEDSARKSALELIAGKPFWRNVLLFALGAFWDSSTEVCERNVVSLCDRLNDGKLGSAGRVLLLGSELALDLLEDRAFQLPGILQQLATRALRLLDHPKNADSARIGRVLAHESSPERRDFLPVLKEEVVRLVRNENESVQERGWRLLFGAMNEKREWGAAVLDDLYPRESAGLQVAARAAWGVDGAGAEEMRRRLAANPWVVGPLMANSSWTCSAPLPWEGTELFPRSSFALLRVAHATGAIVNMCLVFLLEVGSRHAWQSFRAAPERLSTQWVSEIAVEKFVEHPNNSTLAIALRELLRVGRIDLPTLPVPWPLRVCLDFARTEEELKSLAAALDEQVAVTQSWQSVEVSASDQLTQTEFLKWILSESPLPEHSSNLPPMMSSWVSIGTNRAFELDLLEAAAVQFSAKQTHRWSGVAAFLSHNLFSLLERGVLVRSRPLTDAYISMLEVLANRRLPLRLLYFSCFASEMWSESAITKIVERSFADGLLKFDEWDDDTNNKLLSDLAQARTNWRSTELWVSFLRKYLAEVRPTRVREWSVYLDASAEAQFPLDCSLVRIASELHSGAELDRVCSAIRSLETASELLLQVTAIADFYLSDSGERDKVIEALVERLDRDPSVQLPEVYEALRELHELVPSPLTTNTEWKQLGLPMPTPKLRGSDDPVVISSIRVALLRGLASLELEPKSIPSSHGQWIVLLGNNGAGKTTVLRAIALALLGQKSATHGLNASRGARWLTTRTTQAATDVRATIEVECNESTFHRELEWSAGEGEYFVPAVTDNERPWVVGYGCRRGSVLGGVDREVTFDAEDEIDSLFDGTRGLIAAKPWLLKRFEEAAKKSTPGAPAVWNAIVGVLCGASDRDDGRSGLLPGVKKIDVENDEVWVEGPAIGRTTLTGLSDGYATTMGWVLDLMARWLKRNDQVFQREGDGIPFTARMRGLVLLDEIDQHLHPLWQTHVIADVRQWFPRMSFVVTTHNALTILGARKGELWVLKRAEDGVLHALQRDVPPGLSAEKVLTGEWFGLESTLDSDTREKLRRHLKLVRDGVQSEERKELDRELRKRLGGYLETSLERMAHSIAAEVLGPSSKEELTPDEIAKAKNKVAERLKTLRSAKRPEPGQS